MDSVVTLALVGATQCALLASVCYLQSQRPRTSDKILTAILALEALRLFALVAIVQGSAWGGWHYVHAVRLTIGPLLLFYTLYLVGRPPKHSPLLALHFLPAGILLIVTALNHNGLLYLGEPEMLGMGAAGLVGLIIFSEALVFLIYGYLAQRKIRVYRHSLKQTHSDIEDLNLSWLNHVCYLLMAIGLSVLAGGIALIINPQEFNPRAGVVVSTFSSLLLSYLIALRGMRQSRLYERLILEDSFHTRSPVQQGAKPEPLLAPVEAGKYESSTISRQEAEHFYQLLVEIMEGQGLYLRHKLKLADLAAATGLHPQQVSQVINQCADKHFYDFVNGYRVQEAIRLMEADTDREESMLDIADKAGFNSPATFYKYFRRLTGMSPKRYLRDRVA